MRLRPLMFRTSFKFYRKIRLLAYSDVLAAIGAKVLTADATTDAAGTRKVGPRDYASWCA